MNTKIQIGILAAIGVLIAAVATMQVAGASSENDSAVKDMTVAQAEELIAAGTKLDAIPKSVWRELLSEEQYEVLWEQDTERAFSGKLLENNKEGVYV